MLELKFDLTSAPGQGELNLLDIDHPLFRSFWLLMMSSRTLIAAARQSS